MVIYWWFNGDLTSDLMGFNGDLMGLNGIYHLVMTNIAMV